MNDAMERLDKALRETEKHVVAIRKLKAVALKMRAEECPECNRWFAQEDLYTGLCGSCWAHANISDESPEPIF